MLLVVAVLSSSVWCVEIHKILTERSGSFVPDRDKVDVITYETTEKNSVLYFRWFPSSEVTVYTTDSPQRINYEQVDKFVTNKDFINSFYFKNKYAKLVVKPVRSPSLCYYQFSDITCAQMSMYNDFDTIYKFPNTSSSSSLRVSASQIYCTVVFVGDSFDATITKYSGTSGVVSYYHDSGWRVASDVVTKFNESNSTHFMTTYKPFKDGHHARGSLYGLNVHTWLDRTHYHARGTFMESKNGYSNIDRYGVSRTTPVIVSATSISLIIVGAIIVVIALSATVIYMRRKKAKTATSSSSSILKSEKKVDEFGEPVYDPDAMPPAEPDYKIIINPYMQEPYSNIDVTGYYPPPSMPQDTSNNI